MTRAKQTTVYVIDDDRAVRHALERLLRSAGFEAHTFATAEAFLNAGCLVENACVIADVRMPGMSGLALQSELQKAGSLLPIIFVTAQDTEEMRTQAVQAGAVALFVKPVDDQALLDAIHWALSRSHGQAPGASPAV